MCQMSVIELTAEQEEAATAIEDLLLAKARITSRYMARWMASTANRPLFGETEFLLRDPVHRLGAEAIDIALSERKRVGLFASQNRGIKASTSIAFTAIHWGCRHLEIAVDRPPSGEAK